MKLSGKDFYRLIFISGILSLVLLSGLGSMEAASGGNNQSKIIQWSQKEINIKGSLGDSYIMSLQFKSENYLSNVSLWVVPELQPFISVSPSNFLTISAGSNYMVNIKITIPYNSTPDYYEGTIHLRENFSTIHQTLKVVVDTTPRIVERVSADISALAGGVITITESESIYSSGFELTIPPGALPYDTTITVGDVTRNIPPPPENMVPIGLPINIEPDGLTLNKPAVIRIPYSDEMLLYAGVSSLNNITLKTFNTVTRMWEDVPVKKIDTANKFIVAEINHFSWYNPFSWFENPFFDKDPATDDKIIDYVVNDWNAIDYIKTTWDVAVTADDIRQVLDSYNDPFSLIPYRSEVGGILTAIDMKQSIDAKDYAETAETGAKWLLKFGLEKAGYPWLATYTGIGFVMYNYFEWFAAKVDEAAFNGQMKCYILFREQGYSHEEIISGQILYPYSPDGYLWCPGTIAVPRVTGKFTPEDVFRGWQAIWEAMESDKYRTQNETDIKNSFIQSILDYKGSSNPKADFTISPSDTGNPPFTVTFNASSSQGKAGSLVKYQWDLRDGSFAEGVEVAKTYTTPKTYNVRLTVYDSANNSSSISKSVNVTLKDLTNQPPVVDFTYQRNPSDPFSINFDASSSYDPDGSIVQYRWSFGDSSIAYGVSPSNTYAAEGNYTVQLEVTDDKLQSTTVIKTIAIGTTLPSVPTNLSATAVSSSQINLSWSASTDDVGVAGYKVYRDGVQVGTSSTTSYSDTGLSPNTTYCYTVSAYDATGDESGQSSAVCATSLSTSTSVTWVKTYGGANYDYVYSMQQTSDIGYVVAGQTSSFGSGDSDFWVLKLDLNGNVQWEKTYGISGSIDTATSIQQTTDGGYIVSGFMNSPDFSILKLNLNGNVQWQKTYDIGNNCFTGGDVPSIRQTLDGGYIMLGHTCSSAGIDILVLKLDLNGNIQWQKTYGNNIDTIGSIQQTSDGGYIVAGTSYAYAGGIWILKLDSNGGVQWQKAYGGGLNEADSIKQTTDGGYIVGGTTSFGVTYSSYLVLKIDSIGNIIWQKAYSQPRGPYYVWNSTYFSSVQQTIDGGYVVGGFNSVGGLGTTFNYLSIIKLDSNGNIQWDKTFDQTASLGPKTPLQQTTDGGYVIASSIGYPYSDFWVLKLDANGNIGSTCQIIGTTNTVVTDTNITPIDTNAIVTDTNATVTTTNVISLDSSAITTTQCSSQ